MTEVMVTINGKEVMIPAPEFTEDARKAIIEETSRTCNARILYYFLKKMEKENEKYKDCGWSVDEFLSWLSERSMGNEHDLLADEVADLLTWCESPNGGKADMEEYLEQHLSHKKAYRVTVNYKRTYWDELDVAVLAESEEAVDRYLEDARPEDILDEIIEDRYNDEVEIVDWGINMVEQEECNSTDDYNGRLICFDAEE